MDYREESFRRKFRGAAEHLSVNPEQVVSLKLRENVHSSEYRHLVEILQHEAGLQCSEVQADLQGRGYLLGDGKTKVIVVEHETGLELLYIAGSIASLIGLVPLVLQGWRALRAQLPGRHAMQDHGIEIRRIDSSGHVQEEHVYDRHMGSFTAIGSILPALSTTAGLIEDEIKVLGQEIQKLVSRVDALEEQHRSARSSSGPRKTISTVTKPRGKKAKRTRSR